MFLKTEYKDKSIIYLNLDFIKITKISIDEDLANIEIINKNGEEEYYNEVKYSGEFKAFVEGLRCH